MTPRRALALLLLAAAALGACGSNSTPPRQDAAGGGGPPPLSDVTGLELAALTLGPDPYVIGTSWYDYTQRTHVLTPRDHLYALRRGERASSIFEIESYYDDQGVSGAFTLRRRLRQDNGQWGPIVSSKLDGNIKRGDLCVDERLEQVGCERSEAFLIFRIVKRALPDAGFAVNDPGVFLRAQRQANPNDDELVFYQAASLESVEMSSLELDTSAARPSSALDPKHSRVGWLHDAPDQAPRQEINFQVTTSMHVALWRAVIIERVEEGGIALELEVLCQRVDFQAQRGFNAEALETIRVELPGEGVSAYAGAQLTLCRGDTQVSGALSDVTLTPYAGRWPEEPGFDLFVEQYQGRLAIRLAPGSLLWNWTRNDPGASLDEPLDPESVWDTFY